MSNERIRIRVTEFVVTPSILFHCLFCGVANIARCSGPHHISSVAQCENCNAPYVIDWNDTDPKQSVIEMSRPFVTSPPESETTIAKLSPGALFVTHDGCYAVKSEYCLGNGNCQCILLDSGEYAYFPAGDYTLVREVRLGTEKE